jgi:hypothetical protein
MAEDDGDLLRAFIKNLVGKDRISQLTKSEAMYLIDVLVAHLEGRPGMATKRELWKINQLVRELGWHENPKRLRAFLKKYYGVDDARFLTHQAAWRVIESLKKIKERGAHASAGEN